MAQVDTRPFPGQKPGTSGLRKRVSEFLEPKFTENYVQSIFDCLPVDNRRTLVIGGDGRYPGDQIIRTVLRMAAANGFHYAIVGQHGWLSTPAASHLVRTRKASIAIILTASHNPGGQTGDFGIKLNLSNGGPAPDSFARMIYERTQHIDAYQISHESGPDLRLTGTAHLEGMSIEIIDPVVEYRVLMEKLFDFDALENLAKSGFRIMFDGLNGISGPYARDILVRTLGFPEASLVRCDPLPDFGGQYPDPNPVYAGRFHQAMMASTAPHFGAACDSDADRHMIMGQGITVTPSDSLAILCQHMSLAPAYAAGISGVARSLGTSTAVDRVARNLGIPCFETPTGWKFFGNLLDAELITLCGEESSGAGSNHIREKDGVWAVLLWLSIIAKTRIPISQHLGDLWAQYGRTYYERRDYEEVDEGACQDMLQRFRRRLSRLVGRPSVLGEIIQADEFAYQDPVDGSVTEQQGIRLCFANGARVIMRLSGTGTVGATLRVYGERHDTKRFDRDTSEHLESLFDILDQVAGISAITRQYAPSLIT
jgi:phosphoglucomutase